MVHLAGEYHCSLHSKVFLMHCWFLCSVHTPYPNPNPVYWSQPETTMDILTHSLYSQLGCLLSPVHSPPIILQVVPSAPRATGRVQSLLLLCVCCPALHIQPSLQLLFRLVTLWSFCVDHTKFTCFSSLFITSWY